MAKKKRLPRSQRSHKAQKDAVDISSSPPIPDRRVMEATLHDLVAGLRGQTTSQTPLEKAQAVIYRAFEQEDKEDRVRMAQEALAISPDCADAYVLLAENAGSRTEAKQLWEQAVAAGERALGQGAMKENVGHFWAVLETRPYMRARSGLANALWCDGHREEAVQHYQEMLWLNPNDNQGIRYALAGCLLALQRDDEVASLLKQFADEGSATWAYLKALLAFRLEGDTAKARRLLHDAIKSNKHVPAYLLGQKQPPLQLPRSYTFGAESEALIVVQELLVGWKATPNATAWLRGNIKSTKAEADAPHPKGPLGVIKKWLKNRLPQEQDVWQAEQRQAPNWVQIGDKMERPWLILVLSHSNELIHALQTTESSPSAAELWDALAHAMEKPGGGAPHRPTELQIRPNELWESLRPHIEEIGIKLVVTENLEHLDDVFDGVAEHLCGKPKPGLLDTKGVTVAAAASFYDAAADFYQQAPWNKVAIESAIQINSDKLPNGPWYATMMGQSGLLSGLAIYENMDVLRQHWVGEGAQDDMVGMSITFGEAHSVPVAEFEAAQKHGWKVARPDAYPCIFYIGRGGIIRMPLPWELDVVQACLRTLPEFIKLHKAGDAAKMAKTVKVPAGEVKLELSWVMN